MTKREWFEKFETALDGIYADEKTRAKEYYEELFDDKIEQGVTEEDILSEFGSPEEVAKKIKEEAAPDGDNKQISVYNAENDKNGNAAASKNGKGKRREKPLSNFGKAFDSIAPIVALVLFFIDGALLSRWGTAWMFFLLVPLAISLEVAIERKNPNDFAYPVCALIIFLASGFYFGWWHPAWIIFMTIPLYYVIVKAIRGARGEDEPYDSGDTVTESSGDDKPKKRSKWWIWLIVAGAITVTIITSMGTLLILGNMNWGKIDHYNFDKIDEVKVVEVNDTTVTGIKIEADVCAVFIEPTDGDDITVEYVKKGFEKGSVTVDNDGGAVTITAETVKPGFLGIKFNFGRRSADKFILVKVPASLQGAPDYEIKVTTGDLKLSGKAGENTLSFNGLTIENVTGDVTLNDVTAAELIMKITTGDLTLENVSANALTAKAVTGDVIIKGGDFADSMTVSVTTGKLKADAVSKKVDLKATTGDMQFTLAADEIKLKLTTGDVNGTIKGVKSEYTIEKHVTTGKCNLADQTGTTNKILTVNATTGDITIEFQQ
ncbi:MAG: DUF4097 family beta strand repeat protein [Clostridia bacterium]|nr:DUF4097 family beta strand repeat protein [Clostridia bacterium]